MDTNLNKQFDKYGYIQVPALSQEEVKALRELALSTYRNIYGSYEESGQRFLSPLDIIENESLLNYILHDKAVQALKRILEASYTIIPDFQVQMGMYGLGTKGNGWHIDGGSEIPNSYMLEKNYRFVKCAFYLQDNTPENGGGIDIIPGRHRFDLRTGNKKIDFLLNLKMTELLKPFKAKRLPIKAGDFVAFDSRLPHRSSLMSDEHLKKYFLQDGPSIMIKKDAPEDKIKIVLFFNACRSEYAHYFIKHCEKRVMKEELNNPQRKELFYTHILSSRYPEGFPENFCQKIEKYQLKVASSNNDELKERCLKRCRPTVNVR
jgi:hypothetical protein